MRQLPIRLRLTVWYLVVFTVALLAFGTSVWVVVRQRLVDEIDRQLQERRSIVEHFLQAQHADMTRDQLREELSEEYETEDKIAWLQIGDQDGNWMFRSSEMAQYFSAVSRPGELSKEGKLWSREIGHLRLRVGEWPVTAQGRQYTVQAAAVTNGVHHSLEKLEAVFFSLAPAFILIASLGSYYMSKRALATVDAITVMARSINEQNLGSRLPALQSHDELQRLSDTLNEMLERIDRSFQKTRQFTADASHELRTPLSLIRTESELALRKSRSEEEYRKALEHVLTESERTSDLIEQLLTLARTDSGSEVLHLHPVNSIALLHAVAQEWEPLFATAHLDFIVELPAGEVVVNADENSLRRLMMLLLDNALKYTPKSGRVTLRATLAAEHLVIRVEDTGIGIEQEHLPRIFDRFYRVDKSRNRGVGGAGLGLSLAKWIAAQHRTEIVAESRSGEGSTFSFQIRIVAIEPSGSEHSGANERARV